MSFCRSFAILWVFVGEKRLRLAISWPDQEKINQPAHKSPESSDKSERPQLLRAAAWPLAGAGMG
jgi:hypothetical protein